MDPTSEAELIQLNSADATYGSLDSFTIEKRIGKGQFSVVFRARLNQDNTAVALKKVQIFEMMDSKARLDCMKEIQLLQVGNCTTYSQDVKQFLEVQFVQFKY